MKINKISIKIKKFILLFIVILFILFVIKLMNLSPQNVYSSLKFSKDGELLVSGSRFGMRVWDLKERKISKVFKNSTDSTLKVFFSPDQKKIASQGIGGTVKIWNVDNEKIIKSINRSCALYFSQDGDNFIYLTPTNNESGVLYSYDFGRDETSIISKNILIDKSVILYPIKGVEMSPKGNLLASYGNFKKKKGSYVYKVPMTDILSFFEISDPFFCSFSPDERYVAFIGNEGVSVWNLAEKKNIKNFFHRVDSDLWINRVCFSPIERKIALGGTRTLNNDKKIYTFIWIWNMDDDKISEINIEKGGGINTMAFSPDGETLAFARDISITLLDVKSEKIIAKLDGEDIFFMNEITGRNNILLKIIRPLYNLLKNIE